MRVADIMTASVVTCGPDTPLSQVARKMCNNDCGAIPVLDDQRRPVGIVTDRDITCRAVGLDADGDVREMEAREVMSRPVVTVSPETTVHECCQVLESNQLRRIIVVDELGACCGIVAQADVARSAPKEETAEVVRAVSEPVVAIGAVP